MRSIIPTLVDAFSFCLPAPKAFPKASTAYHDASSSGFLELITSLFLVLFFFAVEVAALSSF